ncbi:MAG TPA: CoA transferase [Candidatus Binataceae bacterium]|nr:CoA transferase [Candidatus Binataceae bacterium]
MKNGKTKLPLEGIRVADFSWIINGPQIAQWLATMGAEVIKIESQVYIDIGRINPSGMADRVQGPNRNGYYHALNYSKKAITLNLASEKGRALADEIIKKSDIVLECFPTPAAKKLGITYDKIRAVKPDIIMMSVSLLGKTGREPASWVGWGPMACSFVGMFDAQGYPDLENPNNPPRQTGGTWPDYAVAGAVTFHILAALRHRNRTGEGQWIDASMGETVIGQMPEWYMDYFMNGRDRRARGNRDDAMAPHNTYPCSGDDKWIAIAVGTQAEWEALCRAMGNPVWTRDARFTDQYARLKNSDELDVHLAQWTRNFEHRALATDLQAAGVAAGPVLDSVEIHEDPHLWEWGFLRKINHHEVGERILPNMPVHMSNVPELHFSMPPDLGEHNRDIFGGLLGLSDAEINLLMEQKVIY